MARERDDEGLGTMMIMMGWCVLDCAMPLRSSLGRPLPFPDKSEIYMTLATLCMTRAYADHQLRAKNRAE